MKGLTFEEKHQGLENALVSFGFPNNYYIHIHNYFRGQKYAIAKPTTQTPTLPDIKTAFMTYEEMNRYLQGYNKALTQPFN